MNIDTSAMMDMLVEGGKIKIEITITFMPSEAPMNHTARCAECGWTKRYISNSTLSIW